MMSVASVLVAIEQQKVRWAPEPNQNWLQTLEDGEWHMYIKVSDVEYIDGERVR